MELGVEALRARPFGDNVGPVHFGLDRPKVGLHGPARVHRGISECEPVGFEGGGAMACALRGLPLFHPTGVVGSVGVSVHNPPISAASRSSWVRRNPPLFALIFLSFGIPELLTGSTTVPGLVTSANLLLGVPLYGSGVLLVRESALRWRKGWVGVLLLGLAYGIVEEGIATKTMINPSAGAAGDLGVYGHFLGVNWIFAVEIDLFHAIYSIALPILLVALIWPERRAERFASDRGLVVALAILAGIAALGYEVFTRSYFPSVPVLAFLVGAIVALVIAFLLFPAQWFLLRGRTPTARPREFGLVAGAFVFALFGLTLLSPILRVPPVLVIAGQILLSALTFRFLLRRVGFERNELAKVAFAAGLLSFWVPWDIALELLGDTGVLLVPLLLYYLLYRLYRRYASPDGRRATQGPEPV
jgi:hypothetical protein